MALLRKGARTIIMVDLLFLLLLGFSFQYIDPDSGTYVVAVLTLIPIVLSFIAAIVVLGRDWTPFE